MKYINIIICMNSWALYFSIRTTAKHVIENDGKTRGPRENTKPEYNPLFFSFLFFLFYKKKVFYYVCDFPTQALVSYTLAESKAVDR